MKINNKKGILFWITGLSGSGKTSLGKKIFVEINKKYGKTILLNGDDLRNIFQLKKYSFSDRYQVAMSYSNFCKKITNQKINLIFTTVSMFHNVRHYNNKNINNYIEIFIKTNIKKIIKEDKKKLYKSKYKKNIVGVDIKFEIPKKPLITLNNNFTESLDSLSKKLLKKIFQKIKIKIIR